MRTTGATTSLCGLRSHDHACWTFSEQSEWQARALEFLTDGLAQGQQVRYIARGSDDELAEQLTPLGDVADLVASGRLKFASIDDAYSPRTFDPGVQVARFADTAREGVDAGFTGVRVAADVSPLAANAAHLDRYARYEYLVDQLITQAPLTGLCGIDETVVGAGTAEKLACFHAVGPNAPFRIFNDGNGIELQGEVDAFTDPLFSWALNHVTIDDDAIVVNVRGVRFLDHRALRTLERFANHHGRKVRLRGGTATTARMIEFLDLQRVTLEAAA